MECSAGEKPSFTVGLEMATFSVSSRDPWRGTQQFFDSNAALLH